MGPVNFNLLHVSFNATFNTLMDALKKHHRRQELFILRAWLNHINLTDESRITDAFLTGHIAFKDNRTVETKDLDLSGEADNIIIDLFTPIKTFLPKYKIGTIRKLMFVWRNMIKSIFYPAMNAYTVEADDGANFWDWKEKDFELLFKNSVEQACILINYFYRPPGTTLMNLLENHNPIPCEWVWIANSKRDWANGKGMAMKSNYSIYSIFNKAHLLETMNSESDEETKSTSSSHESLASVPSVQADFDPILKVIGQWIKEKPGLAIRILEIVAPCV